MANNRINKTRKATAAAANKMATGLYKSKFAINASPVYISDNMSGKMSGFPSISTSVLKNKICQQRCKNANSICAHCFAVATVSRYTALEKHLEENTVVLTESVIDSEKLPKISFAVAMCRLESFGDLNNVTQVINYFNICRKNPHVHFALWSKNPFLIGLAIAAGYEKPDNLNIIYSSPILNKPELDIMTKYPFIDKVFTVYDKKTIASEKININCGAKSCAGCGLCYFDKTVKVISEQLK